MNNQIIESLASDESLKRFCRRLTYPEQLGDDLFHEMIITLHERVVKEPVRMAEIHSNSQIKYYAVCVIGNMWRNPRSNFNKKYARFTEENIDVTGFVHFTEPDQTYDFETDKAEQTEIDRVNSSLEGLYWYERDLIMLYYKSGKGYRGLSEKTHIPFRSIGSTIKKGMDKIKAQCLNH